MRVFSIYATVVSALALPSFTTAQCELYYKFDRGVGTDVVNYGTAVVASKMVNAGVGPWTSAGKYGGALHGSSNTSSTHYNYCDTGYGGAVGSSFTISWWCKQQYDPSTTLSYVFSGRGSFRCFTNGVAGSELWLRAWGGSPADLKMPTSGASFKTRATAAAGVNIALVVDGVANQAQWYVDGAPHGAAITLTASGGVAAGANLLIGRHTSNTNSFAYNVDEFRFCNRAASAAEIKAWHLLPHAADGMLGAGCGMKIAPTGGAPTAGNGKYGVAFKGPAPLRYLFVLGIKPQPGFDMGMVFPALQGCMWYAQFGIFEFVGSESTGSGTVPLPLPTSAAGAAFEIQMLGLSGSTMVMAPAMSVAVEKQ